MNLQTRPCSDCKQVGEHYRNRANRHGFDNICKTCRKKRVRAHALAHPELHLKNQRSYRIRKHGITEEQFAEMGHHCQICGEEESGSRRLSIDHDHGHCSGIYGCAECVRGVLCSRCNFIVGALEDRDLLAKALAYLGGD